MGLTNTVSLALLPINLLAMENPPIERKLQLDYQEVESEVDINLLLPMEPLEPPLMELQALQELDQQPTAAKTLLPMVKDKLEPLPPTQLQLTKERLEELDYQDLESVDLDYQDLELEAQATPTKLKNIE